MGKGEEGEEGRTNARQRHRRREESERGAASSSVHKEMLANPQIQALLSLSRYKEKTLFVHLLPVEHFAYDDGVRSLTDTFSEWEAVAQAYERVLGKARVEVRTLGQETLDFQDRVEAVRRWMSSAEGFQV